MKDWLSELIKTKSVDFQFSAGVGSVVDSYAPFLNTLSAATGASMQRIVADALFAHLSKKANIVAHTQKLSLLKADSDEWKTPKSGTLDAVSADCLRLTVSYLSTADRCLAVERTCKRLFHASRDVPLRCYEFAKELDLGHVKSRRKVQVTDVIRLAHRFHPRILTIDPKDSRWRNDDFSEEQSLDLYRKSTTVFQKKVECVVFYDEIDFAATHFSRVKEVRLNAALDSGFVGDFLHKHRGTLTHVTLEGAVTASLFQQIADSKFLRKVTMRFGLYFNSWNFQFGHDFEAVDTANFGSPNFDHIESLELANCECATSKYMCGLFHKGLLHLKLEHGSAVKCVGKLLREVNEHTFESCEVFSQVTELLPQVIAAMNGFTNASLRFGFSLHKDCDYRVVAKKLANTIIANKSTASFQRLVVEMDTYNAAEAIQSNVRQLFHCLALLSTALPPATWELDEDVWAHLQQK